ncbi:hypothetical protein V6N13_050645 [Hibiscus sabdariffa]|uniref:SHSP domain-containing protein n=1 Tax=Hibiscus sabdariffa TaxID=183260 RepID=A0ABR2PI29_9ROSI
MAQSREEQWEILEGVQAALEYADMDHLKAHLEDGVLKITVPKFADEAKRQSKVIDIEFEAVIMALQILVMQIASDTETTL